MNENNNPYSQLRIDAQKIIAEYSSKNKVDDEFCLNLFNTAYQEKNAEKVEDAIIIASASDYFSNRFSDIFCKLLQEDWHYEHENIARILQDLKDASTVECLFRAAQLHFDYLDYDDTYQFARKCIKALSAIDNKEAINKLQLLAKSEIVEIRQYAIKELRYKGLSD